MRPERWPEIKRILDESASVPPEELTTWVHEICGNDEELRHEVASLLSYEDELDLFAESPAQDLLVEETDVGRRFGPYVARQLLGQGGMGAVYLADREEGFEQQVALKVVPASDERPHVLRRFYRERQILARLEHPNIAHLLDGGTSDDGRPFFALELVDGVPIDDYCATKQLSVRERVVLFLQVCEAIRFAHRNLVVHRDLKPDNILVTKDGTVKLLDFGIAKQQQPGLDEQSEHGEPMPMTLRYASPEQLRLEPIATSSDIYSLGVVLYQLLTGSLPCGVESRDRAAATRAVCEEPPLLPSVQVVETKDLPFEEGQKRTPITVARERGASPLKLSRQLYGDLDAIVIKTLSKDPAQRYASVELLIADLTCYLHDMPVQARRGPWSYKTGKYVRRHRWGVASGTLVAGLILSFTTALACQLAATERQRDRAEALSNFLSDLFREAEPDRAGQEISLRNIVDIGRQRLQSELSEDPEVRAKLLVTLGEVYGRLGDYDAAQELLESARILHAGDEAATAVVLSDLAALADKRGQLDFSEELYRQVIAIREKLGMEDGLIKPRNGLARILMARGQLDEAEKLYQLGLQRRREMLGNRHPNVAKSLIYLAATRYTKADFNGALPLLVEARSIRAEALGSDSTAYAAVLALTAQIHHARGDTDQAEKLFNEALKNHRRRLGPDHLTVAMVERSLAALYIDLDRLNEAGALLDHARPVLAEHKAEDDWARADADSIYGTYLLARGDTKAAAPLLRRSYEILRKARGEHVIYTQQAHRRLEALP